MESDQQLEQKIKWNNRQTHKTGSFKPTQSSKYSIIWHHARHKSMKQYHKKIPKALTQTGTTRAIQCRKDTSTSDISEGNQKNEKIRWTKSNLKDEENIIYNTAKERSRKLKLLSIAQRQYNRNQTRTSPNRKHIKKTYIM